jgi:hypothetical protein
MAQKHVDPVDANDNNVLPYRMSSRTVTIENNYTGNISAITIDIITVQKTTQYFVT